MRRVFITGIKGFMGSHLANSMTKQNWSVSGIDNDFHSCTNPIDGNVEVKFGDIRKIQDMDEQISKADLVIHLAAQIHVDYSIKYPKETLDINVNGTLNVLELCRAYKVQCIIASTSEVYGSSQSEYMDETHSLNCQSPYGASKVAADRLAKSYIDTYNMNIQIVRNFNAFGPYQNDGSYGSVIARFAKAALTGRTLYIYGDGTAERDYMYIDDIIRAYDFVKDQQPGVYNFGTGKCFTIEHISKVIVYFYDSSSKILHTDARAGEVQRLCCGIGKVKDLGWAPNTDFERDLKKYLTWFEENI